MVVDTFEIRGTLTFSDLVRFQYFNMLRRVWPAVPMLLLIPPLNFWLFTLGEAWSNVASNLLPFTCLILFWLLLPAISTKLQLKARRYLAEETKYVFDPEGFRLIAPSFSTSMKWQIVRAVRETKTAFLLYSGPGTAYVVPKRYVAGQNDLVAWKSAVASWLAPKAIRLPGVAGKWL